MKNVLMIAIVLFSYSLVAQPGDRKPSEDRKENLEKMKDWSPEQHAELRTKKMALHLDLSEAQQSKVYPIELEIAKKRLAMREAKNEKAKKSSDEMFEMKKNLLEEKLSIKEQYKSVLTPEQFEKWEKTNKRKKGRNNRKKARHRK